MDKLKERAREYLQDGDWKHFIMDANNVIYEHNLHDKLGHDVNSALQLFEMIIFHRYCDVCNDEPLFNWLKDFCEGLVADKEIPPPRYCPECSK